MPISSYIIFTSASQNTGIPLLWNMLAGLQFEEGEFPPFRSLYTWRPQRVIYNELPDTATSNLTLWGEGTFLRDLASYRY